MNSLVAIALLCQVTGTYGSVTEAVSGGYNHERNRIEQTYEESAQEQLRCQKYYVKCLHETGDLDQCVLRRK